VKQNRCNIRHGFTKSPGGIPGRGWSLPFGSGQPNQCWNFIGLKWPGWTKIWNLVGLNFIWALILPQNWGKLPGQIWNHVISSWVIIRLHLKWTTTHTIEESVTSTQLIWRTLPHQTPCQFVSVSERYRIDRSMTILKKCHLIQFMYDTRYMMKV
jgi:hypothetical protein